MNENNLYHFSKIRNGGGPLATPTQTKSKLSTK